MSNTSITTNIKSRRKSSKSSTSSGLEADKKPLRTVQRNVSQGIFEDVEKVVDADESTWLDSNSSALTLSMVHEASSKADVSTARLTTLALSGRNISCISSLKECCNLRILDLSFNRIRILENLDYLYQLRELKLATNYITTLSGLNKLTALEVLHVQDNRLIEVGKQSLNNQKKLRSLRLDGNKIRNLSGLDSAVGLTHLDASQNELTKIEGLGLLAQLETVNLSHNQISTIEGLSACARLKELDLTGNCVQILQGLNKCPSIEILRLESNHLREVSALTRLTALSELYLADNSIERCVDFITQSCTRLEFLSLSKNQLKELKDLQALGNLTGLIDLKLAGNPLCSDEKYNDHIMKYLTLLDSLDDLDLRKIRPVVDQTVLDRDQEFLFGDDAVSGAVENKLALLMQQGGQGDRPARKELETVLSTEEFERQLREMRDAILALRRNVDNSIVAFLSPKPNPATLVPKKSEHGSGRQEVSDRFGGSGYGTAETAVAKTLERLRSLREGSGYLSVPPPQTRAERPAASNIADPTPAVLSAALQRLDEELNRRLAATADLIREEAEGLDSDEEAEPISVHGAQLELASNFFATELPIHPVPVARAPPPTETLPGVASGTILSRPLPSNIGAVAAASATATVPDNSIKVDADESLPLPAAEAGIMNPIGTVTGTGDSLLDGGDVPPGSTAAATTGESRVGSASRVRGRLAEAKSFSVSAERAGSAMAPRSLSESLGAAKGGEVRASSSVDVRASRCLDVRASRSARDLLESGSLAVAATTVGASVVQLSLAGDGARPGSR